MQASALATISTPSVGGGPTPEPASSSPAAPHPFYGQTFEFGANWRMQFIDADGVPLNMLSFEQIDFGAIAYREIFQNVKVILSTPLYSAALERLLGIDQRIVDLPMLQASQATIAVLDAIYFWEPRAQAMNILFSSDVISGHLKVDLQLNIKNVIYGTTTPYDRANIFAVPLRVTEGLPSTGQIVTEGQPGPQGPPGIRGTLWFAGSTDPTIGIGTAFIEDDNYLNADSGDYFVFTP